MHTLAIGEISVSVILFKVTKVLEHKVLISSLKKTEVLQNAPIV